jgi:hypothetical protein
MFCTQVCAQLMVLHGRKRPKILRNIRKSIKIQTLRGSRCAKSIAAKMTSQGARHINHMKCSYFFCLFAGSSFWGGARLAAGVTAALGGAALEAATELAALLPGEAASGKAVKPSELAALLPGEAACPWVPCSLAGSSEAIMFKYMSRFGCNVIPTLVATMSRARRANEDLVSSALKGRQMAWITAKVQLSVRAALRSKSTVAIKVLSSWSKSGMQDMMALCVSTKAS